MKISPTIQRVLHELYLGTTAHQAVSLEAAHDLNPHNERIDLVRYERAPEGVFGDDAYGMRSHAGFRDDIYNQKMDTTTTLALDKVDAAILAELECKAFYTVHGNEQGIKDSNKRLTDIVKFIDDFQQDEESQANWIEQKSQEHFEKLREKQQGYLDRKLGSRDFETDVFEQTVTAYMEAAHAFVYNSDTHIAMMVMYLSEDPQRKGDKQHQMYHRAMVHELDCSKNLLNIAKELYPAIKNLPHNDLAGKPNGNRMN